MTLTARSTRNHVEISLLHRVYRCHRSVSIDKFDITTGTKKRGGPSDELASLVIPLLSYLISLSSLIITITHHTLPLLKDEFNHVINQLGRPRRVSC